MSCKRKFDAADSSSTQESKYFRVQPVQQKLNFEFYDAECVTLAKSLLGKILCKHDPNSGKTLKGRIVETESYLGTHDKASHSYNGRRTPRNEPMYMSAGTVYVYFTYGMYHCFNISSKEEGGAVLIRSLEPLENIDLMRSLRSKVTKSLKDVNDYNLCNGPSKLCMAYDINKENANKIDLCSSSEMWIEDDGLTIPDNSIGTSKRIGIGKSAEEWIDAELRYFIDSCKYVSKVKA